MKTPVELAPFFLPRVLSPEVSGHGSRPLRAGALVKGQTSLGPTTRILKDSKKCFGNKME